jgi:hypothetical protein
VHGSGAARAGAWQGAPRPLGSLAHFPARTASPPPPQHYTPALLVAAVRTCEALGPLDSSPFPNAECVPLWPAMARGAASAALLHACGPGAWLHAPPPASSADSGADAAVAGGKAADGDRAAANGSASGADDGADDGDASKAAEARRRARRTHVRVPDETEGGWPLFAVYFHLHMLGLWREEHGGAAPGVCSGGGATAAAPGPAAAACRAAAAAAAGGGEWRREAQRQLRVLYADPDARWAGAPLAAGRGCGGPASRGRGGRQQAPHMRRRPRPLWLHPAAAARPLSRPSLPSRLQSPFPQGRRRAVCGAPGAAALRLRRPPAPRGLLLGPDTPGLLQRKCRRQAAGHPRVRPLQHAARGRARAVPLRRLRRRAVLPGGLRRRPLGARG